MCVLSGVFKYLGIRKVEMEECVTEDDKSK